MMCLLFIENNHVTSICTYVITEQIKINKSIQTINILHTTALPNNLFIFENYSKLSNIIYLTKNLLYYPSLYTTLF